jgi:ABC-type anion transport system duplicated permease subunit
LINYKNRITGIVGLLISVILIISFSTIVLKLTDFSEKHISQDHQIELSSIKLIKLNLIIIVSFIIVLSIGIFFNLHRKLLHISSNLIDLFKIKDFFLTDDICSKKQTPIYIFIISIISGLLIYCYLLFIGEPKHEGVLEKYSSFLFFISGW